MENNQINNNVNYETKYSPLKDGSFWTAFIVSLLLGGQSFLVLITTGKIIPTFYVGLVLLVSWTGWIIYKKGKKGSLLIGFIIAIVLAGISFYPAMKIEESQREKQFNASMEKYRQQMQIELDKTK